MMYASPFVLHEKSLVRPCAVDRRAPDELSGWSCTAPNGLVKGFAHFLGLTSKVVDSLLDDFSDVCAADNHAFRDCCGGAVEGSADAQERVHVLDADAKACPKVMDSVDTGLKG